MTVSQEYVDYVLEQLEPFGSVQPKRMFGGVGLYHEQVFFALISDDTLFFKVDDSNRADYQALGMDAFQPYKDKPASMQYYSVPIEVLEDPDQLALWARAAHQVAVNARS